MELSQIDINTLYKVICHTVDTVSSVLMAHYHMTGQWCQYFVMHKYSTIN